ncbi:MAG: N-6 DNA methylase [bacterium]|nr:N-6 DNA methylase [Acidimicrobiia bacterium]MCY4649772.1 N-6 DNA methylase [bacterium]
MKERLHVLAAGGLLSRDMLNQISASDQALTGTGPTDYGLVQGERIGDAAARSWNRLVGIWANFRQAESRLPDTDRTATTLTRDRWLKPLLEELGFVGLPRVQAFTIDEKDYPISHEWDSSVPVHQLGWRLPVDKRTPGITGAAKTSPHSLLQEFLNRSDQHLWGIVTNGQVLRLLRDNATLTRQAYCEFDLRAIFDGNAYSDFQTLWRICHRTRFEGNPPANCYLEKWNLEAITAGTRALDQLREGVENALLELGNGFLSHRANTQLRESIRNGELTADDYLRQLLRLVYRMLFLLVAESREVLLDPEAGQAAKDRYYRYYSMTRLRKLAERRRGTAHSDLWQSLQVTMNSLDSQSAGISALGLVPLGSFLWSPNTVTDIHRAQIDNRHLLAAVHHLSFTRDTQAKVPRPVDYRNLGSEELGSVYESLLELHADINGDARTFKLDTAAGSERKVTGSYYTPTVLIDRLLDEALDPLLDKAEQSPHAEEALLDLRVLDPACGSGHFLIAAAHRIAGRLAGVRAVGEEPTPDQLRTALRDVVGQCVYGIDINPMAVELCKVSLWLEVNHHGQPLNFLDHHIVCGNSLLGTTPELLADGIPQTAFKKPLIGDDPNRVAQLRKINLAERKQRKQGLLAFEWEPQDDIAALADDFAVINTGADTTTADVEAKAELYEDLQQSDTYRRAKLAADAWCAAFVTHKLPRQPGITDSTIRGISQGNPVNPDILASVQVLADQYQFLHLRLAFPDVFDEAGGFHLVIGNPPWDKVEFNEREFFATRQADIAALTRVWRVGGFGGRRLVC